MEKASINSSGLFTSTTIDATALTGNLPAISGASLTSLPAHTGNVAFPATQVASADANTLDDYEEGTWTPTLRSATTTTYNSQQGQYVKVGKCVYVMCKLEINSVGDGSAGLLDGLPFTVSNAVEQASMGAARWSSALSSFYSVVVNPSGTVTYCQIYAITGATATVPAINYFTDSSTLRFTAYYFI